MIFGAGRDSQLLTRASVSFERAAIVRGYTSLARFSTTVGLMKSRKRKPKFSRNLIETNKDIPCHTDGGDPWRPDDELSEEQRFIFDLVLRQEKSIFFTGPAGTGKSVLLGKIVKSLTQKYLEDRDCVAVTASTGLAASNISGTTLHRFAGIGIGKAPTTKLINEILTNRVKWRRWLKVRVLIIDEVSMIGPTLFDKLDVIARAVRGVDMPFGGIQLVVSGDFFQLPPVVQGSDDGSSKFCFEAKAWKSAIPNTVNLTKVYRQKDPILAGMLNEIREGNLSKNTIDTFKKLNRPLQSGPRNLIEPTELYPLRREADAANEVRMHRLEGSAHTYYACDGGIVTDPATRNRLLNDCIAPKTTILKEGCQVVLIKNIDETLINGSQGRVIGFANEHTFFHRRWDDDDAVDFGCLLPSGPGQAPKQQMSLYPVVRFKLKNQASRVELCKPMEWSVERWVPDPWADDGWIVEKLATRVQIPLILGWALSIHKAQGQTLERVKVDLDRVFEMGQTYVALSRATSLDGLQVLNFDPYKVFVHPKVKAFYAELSQKSMLVGRS